MDSGLESFLAQTGNVTFYAFSPASNSSVTFNTTSKTLTYTAPTGESSQQDVLYAYKTSARPTNNTVDLTFNHANAAFSVNARLATGCTATVNVSGVQLVNVKPTNTLTFTNGNATASGSNITSALACSAKTLTTSNQAISSSPLIIPPQSVTAWSGTGSLANTYLAVTCKVQANDSYVVGSADANGIVYVPMNKTLNKGEDNSVNLVFGSEVDGGRSYGRDDKGNRITVSNYNGPMNAVDLGLSVLWGDNDLCSPNMYTRYYVDFNNYPKVYISYFNWGRYSDYPADTDNEGYRYGSDPDESGSDDENYFDFTWEHTPYYKGNSNGSNSNVVSSWNKYTTSGQTLELSDDIAHILLGGKWRMPTEAEWQELIDNCRWDYYGGSTNGVNISNSYTVYGTKTGYTNNFIYISADGGYVDGLYQRDATWFESDDDEIDKYYIHTGSGYYWTSTMSSNPSQARGVKSKSIGDYERKLGFRIRPVCDK